MGTPAIDENVLYIGGTENASDRIAINYETLRRSVMVLRAINHQLRQDMVKLLEEEGPLTVTEMYIRLRLEQSVASQHLAILRRAGILLTERQGKFIYYSLNKTRLKDISLFIEELANE